MKMSIKGIAGAVVAVIGMLTITMCISWNDAGKRQVVQYANGTLSCTFDPGPYAIWFGSSHEYNDVMTFDFDKTEGGAGATLDQSGIAVRYRDGGLGTVFGQARYGLPGDCQTMLKIHKEFRSNNGLAFKLLKPYTEEIANQTAGLMTSEESYAEKRGIFTDWFRTQLNYGRYKTRMDEIVTAEPGREYCLDTELLTKEQKVDCRDVKKTRENVPVIDNSTSDIHLASDIKPYGLSVTGFQLQAPDYEPKTLQQISDKRDATMGVITANANAERAKAEAAEKAAQGEKAVIVAQFTQEEIKIKAVVTAQQVAEVAVIKAEQLVDVATAKKDEAAQKALAAIEYKKEQVLIGEGDAERKRLVMEADGALEQKLQAWTQVNEYYANAVAKQKWVPEVQMGEGGTNGSAATDLVKLMTVSTAKQLGLDMQIK